MDPKKSSLTNTDFAAISESLAEEKSSIDQALNTKGFAEFVALHNDAEEIVKDEKRAEEVLAVFQKKDALIEFSRKMLSEQIGKEIGTEQGLKLSKEELGGVDQYLSKLAVEDSESFLRLVNKSERFQVDDTEIKGLEARLKELGVEVNQGVEENAAGSNKDELLKKASVLQGVQGSDYLGTPMNTFGKMFGVRKVFLDGALNANRTAASEQYGLEKNWYGKFKDLDDQIEITQGLIELQDLKKSLVKDIFPASVLEPVIQAKVAKHLSEMSLATKLEELEKAQAFLEKAQLASEKGLSGTDYLGSVNEVEAQKNLDEALSSAIVSRVDESISNSTLGNNALSRLEKSLKDFMTKEKLGSKDKDQYQDFLVKTLEEQVSLLSKDDSSKAKAVLIRRIIIKIDNA